MKQTEVTDSIPRKMRWLAPLVVELLLVSVFTVWVSWSYLGGTPSTDLPAGGDYSISIQGRFFWEHVKECGTCALWNGDLSGGNPALIDTSSDLLHPVVALPVLLFGTLEGSRIAVTLTMIMAGFASWWLAYLLGTGWIARLYAGCLGAAGGYMTGRLDYGLVVLMTSLATASFLLPASVYFSRRLDRRATALLGCFLGLTAISGQAYIQLGVLLLSPAIALLLVWRGLDTTLVIRRCIQAGAMAICFVAVLLLPVLHYRKLIDKDFDPYFSRSQPFRYVPLNLVIDQKDYYSSSMFQQPGYPGWHSNYLGWIAIIFAVFGSVFLLKRCRREALFLIVVAIGALWLGSGELFKWIAGQSALHFLLDAVVRLRTTSNIANLAAPAIIGLSACGVEAIHRWLKKIAGLRITVSSPVGTGRIAILLTLGFLVLVPAIWSVHDVAHSAQRWNGFNGVTSDPKLAIVRELGQTTEMQWVGGIPMTGQLALLALDNGLKLGNQWQPWRINPALSPEPSIWITDGEQPASSHRVDESQGTNVFAANDGNVYAVLETASGHQIACSAVGRGAQIDVACPNSAGGTLSVQERALKGWEISLDGQDANLDTNAGWIAVDLPQDVQQISFRFHSPYLRTSILLLIVGILWGAWWLIAPGWHPISTVSRKLKTA